MPQVPLVSKSCGGDQLNIAAGGVLSIAGVSWLTTAGYLGDQRMFWELSSGQGGVLTNYGLSVIATSDPAAGNLEFSVQPAAGRIKYIMCLTSTATLARVAVTTGTWDGTNRNVIFTTGSADPQAIMAIGASTTRWYLIPLTTCYTVSNT